MATRTVDGASEWDPKYLGMGMVAFTTIVIGLVQFLPRSTPLKDLPGKLTVVASGQGDNAVAGPSISDPRTGAPQLKVAAWAMVAHNSPLSDHDLSTRVVKVLDEAGRQWPARCAYSPDGFTIVIPEGYAKAPKELYAEVSAAGTRPQRVRLPGLPEPHGYRPPNLEPIWPGMKYDVVMLDTDRRSRVGIELTYPLPEGHVLAAQQVGSSATRNENVTSPPSLRYAFLGLPTRVPLRLHYPATTREAYVKVLDMAPEKRHAHVRVVDHTPTFKFGQWWLPPAYRTVRLPDGQQFLIMTTDREVFRAPSHPRKAIQLYFVPLGTMRVDRVDLVSPTHLGGVPLRVLAPPIWSSVGNVDYEGEGPMDLVFDLEYTVFSPVRESVVAIPLPMQKVADLMGVAAAWQSAPPSP
jgi:hypothetical protein